MEVSNGIGGKLLTLRFSARVANRGGLSRTNPVQFIQCKLAKCKILLSEELEW